VSRSVLAVVAGEDGSIRLLVPGSRVHWVTARVVQQSQRVWGSGLTLDRGVIEVDSQLAVPQKLAE
jgi:hypothetical protein